MTNPQRVHILGASGSGVSTLGRGLAERLHIPLLDMDDFFWKETDPPYQEKNERELRIRKVDGAIQGARDWIMAGSMCGWGDKYIPHFTIVVFVFLAPEIRIRRLMERERAEFGERIETGGDLYSSHTAFIKWASAYDDGGTAIRSLRQHKLWLQRVSCPILRVDSEASCGSLVDQVCEAIGV